MIHATHADAVIKFQGRSRTETKRKALGYWTDNGERFGLSLRDFLGACTCSADGLTISFRMPARREKKAEPAKSGAQGARSATEAIENIARRGERKLKIRAFRLLRRIGVKA